MHRMYTPDLPMVCMYKRGHRGNTKRSASHERVCMYKRGRRGNTKRSSATPTVCSRKVWFETRSMRKN